MSIEFRCPECRKLLRTPDGTAGLEAQCPRCQAIAVVPGGTDVAQAEQGPAAPPPPLPPRDDAIDSFAGIDVAGRNPFSGYAPASTAAEGEPAEFNPYTSPATIDTS